MTLTLSHFVWQNVGHIHKPDTTQIKLNSFFTTGCSQIVCVCVCARLRLGLPGTAEQMAARFCLREVSGQRTPLRASTLPATTPTSVQFFQVFVLTNEVCLALRELKTFL